MLSSILQELIQWIQEVSSVNHFELQPDFDHIITRYDFTSYYDRSKTFLKSGIWRNDCVFCLTYLFLVCYINLIGF